MPISPLLPVVTPNTYSPVGADIWFGINSASSGLTNFKYLFNVWKYDLITNATSSLGAYKLPPRPVSGNGLISVSDIIKPQMNWSFTATASAPYALTTGVIKFGFLYDSSYNPNWSFDTLNSEIGGNVVIASKIYVYVDVLIGDYVTVLMDLPTNSGFNGRFEVLDSYQEDNIQYIVIDQVYTKPNDPASGAITSIERTGNTSSQYYAYQGTRQYTEINKNFGTERVILNGTYSQNYLSNYNNIDITSIPADSPNNYIYGNTKDIFTTQYETLSFLIDPGCTSSYMRIQTYDIQYNTLTYSETSLYTALPSNGKYIRYDLPAGPMNIINGGYISSASMSQAKYYSVAIVNKISSVNYLKAIRFYEIVPNCSKYPTNYRLVFMNRHGGTDYWNFNWKSTNVLTQTQTIFRRQLAYNYSVGDRQDTVLSNKANETYTISSYWISERDSNFLKELITSPDVYVFDEVNNVKLPIIILDTTYQVKTAINDKQFCLTVNFRYAYDTDLQNN